MRQWMVDPRIMCRKHLLGEHVEHHMFIASIKKDISLTGFLNGNLLEPTSLQRRHDEIVIEMESRGYKHKSPLPEVDVDHLPNVTIDRASALVDLLSRCPDCFDRYSEVING